MPAEPAAPKIRRYMLNSAQRVLEAQTKRDRGEAFAALFAYSQALKAVVSGGGDYPGIATGAGTSPDGSRLQVLQDFLGSGDALHELGF